MSVFQWFGDKIKAVVNDKIDRAALATGQRLVDTAQRLAPVDTGFLRGSIHFTYDPGVKRLELIADAPYAMYVEYGTYKQPPHPFLRPAVQMVGPSFFSPYGFGMTVGTTMGIDQQPRKILPHVRPSIAAANRRYNTRFVRKTPLTAIHHRVKNWHGQAVKRNKSAIHKYRKAWN